jgi:hypothetical protein
VRNGAAVAPGWLAGGRRWVKGGVTADVAINNNNTERESELYESKELKKL